MKTTKLKYFAYLHINDHWVIKKYTTRARFMEILRDGFYKDSNVKGVIMPFELEIPRTKENDPDVIFINLSEIEAKPMCQHPALLHIKELINKIDWKKG
ncbi:MAG: hypothetical protein Q8936_14140 [Bacillota bacterium]|nr:hypothetical protein [Bacillota bacterium]